MDSDSDENERTLLIRTEKLYSDSEKSFCEDSQVFFKNMVKTSTQAGLLGAWGGRSSNQDAAGRMRRTQSWSGCSPDDCSSEIRILRERLVRTQTRPRPGAVKNLSNRQRLTLISLALVDFMSFCSMSVMAPFFPKEASLKGLSNTTCGMVFSFYAVVMFFTSPVFGKFLPVVGAKFMFTSGMFIAGGCNVLFGTLAYIQDQTLFTSMCFLVRGLEALGASAYSTASYVFVVNTFPDNIGTVLGILETFVGLGMSVGPAIGGLLYSIGGFGLPFYTLGIIMVVTVPLNYFLLSDCQEYISSSKTASIFGLFKIPSIIITGLVIVVMSNTWAFLDPTLEPHLRQFGLTSEKIGLIFLLFSSLYGIFSPIWGWVADRVNNHWCMMVWGLFLSTIGLVLLGPCPLIPGLPTDLWLDLVALSILGISVALTLLPTFQGVLTSSIYEGGCPEALATYSAVAGVWSCCYSLGEVTGPTLGGALAEYYGFPLSATICAAACFTMAIITLTFFSLRESNKIIDEETVSDSIPYTDTTWNSNMFCRANSEPEYIKVGEESPLSVCDCSPRSALSYGNSSPKSLCKMHNSNRSKSTTFTEIISYILKFKMVTNIFIRLKRKKEVTAQPNPELYQNYLENNDPIIAESRDTSLNGDNNNKNNVSNNNNSNEYVKYIESAIFGSSDIRSNSNLVVKSNNKGLAPILKTDYTKEPTVEILKHNLEKIVFIEQNEECDVYDDCECKDEVTYVRGTLAISSSGACEV